MNLDQALFTFIEESRELLSDMEDSLLRVVHETPSPEHIHAIFRAAHTIKGSAGLFGLDALVGFTHVAESLLDEVRNGDVLLNDDLVQLLLNCCDHLQQQITSIEHNQGAEDSALTAQGQALMDALQAHSKAACNAHAGQACANDAAAQPQHDAAQDWRIAAEFGPSVLQNGMEPLSFLRYLHSMGQVLHSELLSARLPNLAKLDPEQCYLGFTLHLRTTASQEALQEVFEFVRDDCTLSIAPLLDLSACDESAVTQQRAAPVEAPAPQSTESLTDAYQANHDAVTAAQAQAPCSPPAAQPSPATAVPSKTRTPDMQSVRVDAHKLDLLIDLVGELIIASAGATEVARRLRQTEMLEANATLTALVEQVRDQALQLRMVKIGGTFNKFQRVVHDVARELGKDIALVVSGEDTELDKTVVERIGDPLTHLVRNAIDHGIESAEVRVARGKPAQGTVRLNAYHESGYIVIEIHDDGGGLDRDRILAKGIERGLVDAGRNLSDQEIYQLIFEPGFSTASQVTNLSGRGVGMDVVRSNITALRGTVELSSTPGMGTTVQVRLPLTLAIINGFQVRVGKSVFVVPLEMVDECVEYVGTTSHCYTDLRGSVLPYVDLRAHFQLDGQRSARPNIVVIKHGNQRFGVLVDELLGEAQTVIKPLSRLFRQAQGISGSSILGNGSVALILDIPVLHTQLLASAESDTSSAPHSAS